MSAYVPSPITPVASPHALSMMRIIHARPEMELADVLERIAQVGAYFPRLPSCTKRIKITIVAEEIVE